MYDQQRTEVLISTDDGNDEWDFRSGLNNLPLQNKWTQEEKDVQLKEQKEKFWQNI